MIVAASINAAPSSPENLITPKLSPLATTAFVPGVVALDLLYENPGGEVSAAYRKAPKTPPETPEFAQPTACMAGVWEIDEVKAAV
jgi:hypothetical protein